MSTEQENRYVKSSVEASASSKFWVLRLAKACHPLPFLSYGEYILVFEMPVGQKELSSKMVRYRALLAKS